ncbi:hypothetical protein ACFU99_25690 [Streptomyces sp. NPDC057654]|uniref:hypothetical protein n=1 Tax=Streptomyces sp. NPDC057654 TaxID=3346196 RepID=UPI0036A3AEA8
MTANPPAALADFVHPPLPTALHARLWNGLANGIYRGSVRRDGAPGRRLLTIARQWEEEGLLTVHTLGRQGWVAVLVPALCRPAEPSRAPRVRLGVLGAPFLRGAEQSDFEREALPAVEDAVREVFGEKAGYFSYEPVRTDSGELAGWTWTWCGRVHWVTVDAEVSPNDITKQGTADLKAAR